MSLRARIRDLLDHRRTQLFLIGAIVATAVALALKTPGERGGFFGILVLVGLGLFVVETVLRIWVYGLRLFYDPWHVFDVVVIAVACVPGAAPFLVLRFLRVLRILRITSRFPTLRLIGAGLAGALPGLVAVGGFIALTVFVGGVIATNLFSDIAPRYFDDLGTTLLTLFQAMTGEGWPDVARAVMDEAPIAWTFFVVYIVLCTLGVLNVLIAVMVSGMERAIAYDDEEEETQESLLQEMRALRTEVAALRQRLDR